MRALDSVREVLSTTGHGKRYRSWWVRGAILVLVRAAAFGLSRVVSHAPKPPLVYYTGSRQLNCFTRGSANQHSSYTLGLATLTNTSSHPVTILSARGVRTSHTRLAQMYIAPWPTHASDAVEGIGTGFGLPSDSSDHAVGRGAADQKLWSQRERLPGAVIQPAKSVPTTMYLVVLGITRTGPQEAYFRDFEITYRGAGSHTYSLKGFAYLLLPSKRGPTNGGCPHNLATAPGGGA